MAEGDKKDTEAMMQLAAGIVDRYSKILTILNRYENEDHFDSIKAIEHISKIVRGETV